MARYGHKCSDVYFFLLEKLVFVSENQKETTGVFLGKTVEGIELGCAES